MDDVMKLTEQDLDDLIDAVGEWGKGSPDVDVNTTILTSLLSGEEGKDNLEFLIRSKRIEFMQKKKQRERDAALLSTKLIMIQRAFLDSPSTFVLSEHIK